MPQNTMGETGEPTDERGTDRRRFLKLTGTSAVVTTGVAGCVGTESGGSGGTPTPTEASDGGGGSTETDDSTPTQSAPDKVLFGQPAALSGKWDFLQPAVSQATDLATKEINEAGGPLGATLNVKRRDTAVDPQKARTVVRQFINNDDADLILGLFSSEIVPLWDFLQKQQMPVVSNWPGTTYLDTRGGDKGTPEDLSDDGWVWRTVIGDTVHTAGAAKAMTNRDATTIGILNGSSAGARSWAGSFKKAYKDLGGTVAKQVEVSEGQSSYQSSLNELFEAEFDAWALAVGLKDATTIIKDWDSAGYGRQLLLEDGLKSPDLIKSVGAEADGALIAAGSTKGPNFAQFKEKFNAAGEADIHPWGVAAYDATNVAALAIHRAGSVDPGDIEKNLGAVAREPGTKVSTFAEGKKALDSGEEINYEGAVTPADFTKFGNVWGNVEVSQVTPDGFEAQSTISADELKESIGTY